MNLDEDLGLENLHVNDGDDELQEYDDMQDPADEHVYGVSSGDDNEVNIHIQHTARVIFFCYFLLLHTQQATQHTHTHTTRVIFFCYLHKKVTHKFHIYTGL
jgi:hypothetical protein